MRTQESHIIQKVFVEVNTDTSAKAYDIQLNSQSFLEKHVFKVVEEYISRLEARTKNWSVQIEKIELDLQLIEGTLGEVELKESVENQLDTIFEPVLRDIELNATENSSEALFTPVLPSEEKVTLEEREQLSILSPKARREKTVLHFVKTGRTPWWIASHSEMREILAEKELIEFIRKATPEFIIALTKLMKAPLVRRRMIRQFTVEIIFEILKSVAKTKQATLEELATQVNSKGFMTIMEKMKPTEKMELLDTIIVNSIGEESPEDIQTRLALVLKKDAETSTKPITKFCKKELPEIVKSLPKAEELELSEESEPELKDTPELEEDSIEETFNHLIAENAGLVILSPFFKPVLNNLDLLEEDGSLKDPVLTAHIFHYLATGEEEDYEFTLIFEAYLCGLPINEPLPKSVPLTDEIKEECQKVLESVLVHWEALKSKSVPLLQNNFLQRPGKLMLKEETPRIIIERTGIDILLDKIPWSISILKLPWHEKMTYVEW